MKRLIVVILLLLGITFGVDSQTAYRKNYPNDGIAITGYVNLRTSAVLTTGYVNTTAAKFDQYKQLCIMFDITQGGLTSFEYKVWISKDGYNWYQEATESVASGVITDTPCYYTCALSADVAYYKVIPFNGRWIKLQVKGTGTVTGSSCSVQLMGAY